jgi:hypothetical protein
MNVKDDRTPAQQQTHTILVVGTDSFMSGWGEASGGTSYAAWACKPEWANACESHVRARKDLKRVRIVGSDYRPRGKGHLHIYVWSDSRESFAS